ncbi:MAG: DUF2092 domain-containing protein [Armatimonadetes bacterium]|nr:DUF2092 domain-containing protein [Armatimonadota bacterium]
MRRVSLGVLCAAATIGAAGASAQLPPAAVVLNRMTGAYRSLESIRVQSSWTLRDTTGEITGNLAIAAKRPNLLAVDLVAGDASATARCDGRTLGLARTSPAGFTRFGAPASFAQLRHLGGMGIASPLTRLTLALMAGLGSDREGLLSTALARMEVIGSDEIDGVRCMEVTLRYNDNHVAKLLVDTSGWLIRRVALVRDGRTVLAEKVTAVEVGAKVEARDVAFTPPDGGKLLPDSPTIPARFGGLDISVKPVDRSKELAAFIAKSAAAYRLMDTLRMTTTWTRTVGDKLWSQPVSLVMSRPNRLLIDAQSEPLSAVLSVAGDKALVVRTKAKAYTEAKAPEAIAGANVLAGANLLCPATEFVAALLQGQSRGQSAFAERLTSATMSGPMAYRGALCYVISMAYSADMSMKVHVGMDDGLVKRAALVDGETELAVEDVVEATVNGEVPAEALTYALPDGARQVSRFPNPALPEPSEVISLTSLTGEAWSLPQKRGKIVVMALFYTTSEGSLQELAELQKLSDQYKGKGLEVLAVNGTGESIDALKTWVAEAGLTVSVATNKSPTDLVKLFSVTTYPTTIIVGKTGRVLATVVGFNADAINSALRRAGLFQQ